MSRTFILTVAVVTFASFAVPVEVLAQEPPGQAVSDSRNKGQQGEAASGGQQPADPPGQAVSGSRNQGQQGEAASDGQREGGEGRPGGGDI